MDKTDQRLILWSISDSIHINDVQILGFSLGGSFNTNFGLQDRYYGQLDYSGRFSQAWRYKLIYNYQQQPQHNHLAQFEIAYVF